MASNTKLGIVLILLIVSAFGIVVYKKVEKHKLEMASIDHSNDAPPPEGQEPRTFGRGGKEPFTKNDHAHQGEKHAHNHGKDEIELARPAPPPQKPKVLPASDEFFQSKEIAKSPEPNAVAKGNTFSDEDLGLDEPFEKDPPAPKPANGKPLPGGSEKGLTQLPLAPAPKMQSRTVEKDAFADANTFESDDDLRKPATEDDMEDPFGGEGDQLVDAKTTPAPPPQKPKRLDDLDNTFEKPAPPSQGKEPETFTADDELDDPEMFDGPAPHPALAKKERAPDDKADFRKHKSEGFVEGSRDMFGKPGPRPVKPKELPDAPAPLPEEAPLPDAPAPAGHEVYVVQVGDSFWSISRKKYGTSRYFRVLAEMNRDAAPVSDEIYPGMEIRIPSQQLVQTHGDEILEQAEIRLASGYYQDTGGRRFYRVGPNDTLPLIASRHLGRDSRWIQIYEMNREKLASPNDLQSGTELVLPDDARRRTVVHAIEERR